MNPGSAGEGEGPQRLLPKVPSQRRLRLQEAGAPGCRQAWFERRCWRVGALKRPFCSESFLKEIGWGTLVEDGAPSLPGLVIQLRKIREVFRSRWNNLIGITRGFEGPVNGP